MTRLETLKAIRENSQYRYQLQNTLKWLNAFISQGQDIPVRDAQEVARGIGEVLG